MRLHLNVLSLLVICVTASGQETLPQPKTRVVLVPREVGLVTVVYQPNCPLQFENAKLLAGVDGGGLESYDIRNLGTKPVRAITIGTSSGNRWTWGVSADEGPVVPGQIPPWSKEEWVEVVPLTKELREKPRIARAYEGNSRVDGYSR